MAFGKVDRLTFSSGSSMEKKTTLTKGRSEPPRHAFFLFTLAPLFVTLKDNRSYTEVSLVHWGFFSPQALFVLNALGRTCTIDHDAMWEFQLPLKRSSHRSWFERPKGVALENQTLLSAPPWQKRCRKHRQVIICDKTYGKIHPMVVKTVLKTTNVHLIVMEKSRDIQSQ